MPDAMALGALSLSTTSGVQGRPFRSAIVGLTTGKVEVLVDGSPGFSTVNGRVSNDSLPYPVSTVVLREYEPGVGQGYRDSRIDITAATRDQLRAQAIASLDPGRTLRRSRVSATEQPDGSLVYRLLVEDDLGATRGFVPDGTTPTPTPTPGETGTVAVSEAATRSSDTYSFRLIRSGDLSGPKSAPWAVGPSALAGRIGAIPADFGGSFPSGTASFAPGESLKTITVTTASAQPE